MTAITIQSNKIVLNELKDNQTLLEPLHKKNQMNFLTNPIYLTNIYTLYTVNTYTCIYYCTYNNVYIKQITCIQNIMYM